MTDNDNGTYKVGYGKPPKDTQFKKGQSGNRGGRPKKKGTTLGEDIEAELRVRVEIKENGKRRKVPKQKAIAKQLVNQAANGDTKCLSLLLKASEQHADTEDQLPAVLEGFRTQYERIVKSPPAIAAELASSGTPNETLEREPDADS